MKNSFFNAVCKTRYLALLVVLIFTCGNAWGTTYQHVFNAKPSTGNSITLSSVSWNITATNLGSYNSGNYAGVQLGSSKSNGSITLTTSSAWGSVAGTYKDKTKITEIRLWLNLGGTSVTPSVTIGGTAAVSDGTTVIKNSSAGSDWTKATKVTFTPATGHDAGVVVINVSTVKAGYICCMEIDCEEPGGGSTCATPTFSVTAGTYTSSQSVTLSCTTTGATIHYTTDGSTPTGSSPTYSSAITVDVTQTIKAIAIKDGMTNSDVAEAAYTIKCATPTFSPAAGTYGAVQSVSISTTYGTNIYYTTDGTTPSTSSTLYSSAISVSESQTIKAIAVKTGCSNSEVGEAAYIINLPYTVSFSTGTGNPTQADITEASAGAGITLPDGPTPACSSDGWSFAGWGYESCDDESTEPTLYIAGNKYYPSSNETLYAVYVKGKTASTNYKLISEAAEIVSGENYVIAAYYNSNDYAITAEIQSSYYIKQTAVTVTENVISSPGANIIWLLTNEGGSNVSLYNSNQSKYLYVYASSSYRNLGLYDSKKQFTMTEEREAEYASTFAFNSTDYTSYYINYDASHTDFGTKTSSDENLYLYKRQYTGTYESNPSCEACEKQVTIIKGTPESGGSFDLDKTGEQDCCEPLVVTVSNIVAPSGKQFGAITQSGFESGVTIDQNAKTVTYAANSNGSSTINVTFVDLPKYTVTLEDDGTELTQSSYGAAITLPSRTGCDGYTFAGWTKTWTSPQSSWTSTAPTIINAGSYTPTGNENLYPVYTKVESGGTPETVTLYDEPFTGSAHSTGVESTNVAATTDMFVDGSATVWSHYSFDAASTAAYANNYGGETISDGIKIKREANNTTVTMMEVTGIKISGASDLELSLCNRRTAASATLNISYKIDDGSYTAVGGTISYNSTNDTWKKCTGLTISGTGTSLALKIELVVSGTTNRTMVLDDIKITGETGGSTTYYISVPGCCEDIVTLATNSPANGSITFSPSGPIATCGAEASSRQTTMTITPDAGYYLSAWSTTGVTPYSVNPSIAYGSVSNSGAQATTVTFNQNTTTGTYTANATFTAIPVSSLSLRAQQTGQSDKTGSDLTMNCYPKEGQTGGNDPLNHSLNVKFHEVLPADALDKTYTWSVRVKATGAADWTNVDFTGNQLNTNAIINYYNNNTGLLKIGTNEGTAEIKITANDGSGVSAKVTITVAKVSVTSISVDPTSMNVYAGQKKPVTITFTPLNASDKAYTTGSYSYVTIRSSGSNPFYIEGNATEVVHNETVTVTSDDGSKTATIDVTVNPLPKATFIDIVHGKTDFLVEGESVLVDGTLTSTVSADGLTVDTEWHTPTHADVSDPGAGHNTCERGHLHLVGWILKDWADANPTATHSDIVGAGATNFYGANEAIDLSSASVNGKTYYAVWAKEVTTP